MDINTMIKVVHILKCTLLSSDQSCQLEVKNQLQDKDTKRLLGGNN